MQLIININVYKCIYIANETAIYIQDLYTCNIYQGHCIFIKITRFRCALKYPEQWEMWISNVKITKPGFVPSRTKYLNRLCSKHFEDELIIHTDKRPTLVPGAIPTKFYTAKQVNFVCFQVA